MDGPTAQLQSELETSLATSLATQRPLLTHLNADTTWLLSIPVPPVPAQPLANFRDQAEAEARSASGRPRKFPGHRVVGGRPGGPAPRCYYHVLIDPWLRGSQSDVTRFLSQQWHTQVSAVQSITEVGDVIAGIEALASAGLRRRRRPRRAGGEYHDEAETGAANGPGEEERRRIDLVVVSHEFTDHMHKATLLEVPAAVPVFATDKAAGMVRSWDHFKTVVAMPKFSGSARDWRAMSVAPLPRWLAVSRLVGAGDLLDYHSAVMLTFSRWHGDGNGDGDDNASTSYRDAGEAEAIIYTPHGISPSSLEPVSAASPPIRTLALMHGLHDINIGSQLNLGGHNGLKAQRLTAAKYWVGTHDEVKKGGGLVSWILRRKVVSLEEALRLEEMEKGEAGIEQGHDVQSMEDVRFVELGNGESLLLE
ncbi:MAG: hypothetical protein M1818_002112 [Claussenomyces sp. TS43310]|nr:MAG: hypothetical protein M1818_002112 [Claussenomyces sp. TS43310]